MSHKYQVAKIDEATCIGCTKCIQVCPFDAIIGANKQMHVVLESLCIGCDLCLAPCPVDAISLIDAATDTSSRERAQSAKERHQARKVRLANNELQKLQSDTQKIENMNDIITDVIKRAELKNSQLKNIVWEYHE